MNDETITFEDRLYVNPEVSMAEQDQFIDKFRNIQAQNQAQINRDTYNLGTPVSSNLGGLTGAEGLWNTQYQRPQVNAAIENLRQVNMQQALNTAMGNQQNVMAERLNQAKRAYYRAQQEASARDRANANNPNNQNLSSGLPINTNSGNNISDLAVRENEEARNKYDAEGAARDEAMSSIIKEQNSDNYAGATSVPFTYKINGKTIYGTMHRDQTGNITGVSTPEVNYNAKSAIKFLNSLAKDKNFFDVDGRLINSFLGL